MKSTTIMQKTTQTGFVSIITVLFLSILITLFTLGFARVMIKGQQNTLNSQLSSQAFYAAETGVNDAIKAIQAGFVPPIEDNDCNPLNPNTKTQLQTQIPIEYTCQLVSSGVKDIQYSASADAPRTFPLFTNGELVTGKDITIDWEGSGDGKNSYLNTYHPATGDQTALLKANEWGEAPAMLRIAVYTLPSGADRAAFNDNQKTIFLTPMKLAESDDEVKIGFNSIADGSVVSGGCKNVTATRKYACRVSLDMSGVANFTPQTYNTVFIRVLPIYHKTDIDIYFNDKGQYNQTSEQKTSLFNAQYSIDSTGRSNDVYRRIQVRIPYNEVTNPPNGVMSSDFCKKFIFNQVADAMEIGTASVDQNSCIP